MIFEENVLMDADIVNLIGDLIGLARATDGNTVRTEKTGQLMRSGQAALAGRTHGKGMVNEGTDADKLDSGIDSEQFKSKDEQEVCEKRKEQTEQSELCKTMIEKIHEEKRILVPDCATCSASCGKTADYDINQWKNEKGPVCPRRELGGGVDCGVGEGSGSLDNLLKKLFKIRMPKNSKNSQNFLPGVFALMICQNQVGSGLGDFF